MISILPKLPKILSKSDLNGSHMPVSTVPGSYLSSKKLTFGRISVNTYHQKYVPSSSRYQKDIRYDDVIEIWVIYVCPHGDYKLPRY